ncbi:formate/nitrite transporter family protein [Wukongibacter sp. M2B1]|uniref:formate/nitrite transporter family protein n=1 Tax=Wukongibacter sp. M2B1 TaxID=3088895 RepID=UPI003D78C42E
MERKGFYQPSEITEIAIQAGVKKVSISSTKLLLLGILAGSFIAFAAEGSNMAAFNLFSNPQTYGLGKAVAGTIFGTGLMLVLIAGAELFTGNTLIFCALLDGKVSIKGMLRNWSLVYIGNFIGSIFVAYMIVNSGQLGSGGNALATTTIKIASYKTGLEFLPAFFLGLMCNWLVCLAVWMSYGAKDITGKIWSVFFPIWLFITSGFEHSIANMYYIPAGILAKGNPIWLNNALESGLTIEKLNHLNWHSFFVNNLIPVTLGNIVGGGLFVGIIYWYIYRSNVNNEHAREYSVK